MATPKYPAFLVGRRVYQFREAYRNPDNGQVRYVYVGTRPDIFVVLKSFVEGEDTPYTFKIWRGHYGATIAHWKSNVPYVPSVEEVVLAVKNATNLI